MHPWSGGGGRSCEEAGVTTGCPPASWQGSDIPGSEHQQVSCLGAHRWLPRGLRRLKQKQERKHKIISIHAFHSKIPFCTFSSILYFLN